MMNSNAIQLLLLAVLISKAEEKTSVPVRQWTLLFLIRIWFHIATHLVAAFLVVDAFFSTKSKAPWFQIGSGWNLARFFFKEVHIDWQSRFSDATSTFKMATMTSFHVEKCRDLVSVHAASAWRPLAILSTVPDP